MISFEKTAVKVSAVSIIANAVLSLFKLLAGFLASSGAMISDAVHSASDVLSSIIVIIGVKMSAKEPDREHQYGHERFEAVTAIVLAVILFVTGIFIGHTVVEKLSGGVEEETIPGVLALIAAIVSIVTKEVMYWYTRFYAKRIQSGALMADAWHHRSDALSSIGALIGIAGARMGYPWLDSVASFVICGFIIKAAFDIFMDAIEKMIDHACDARTQNAMRECALRQDGVQTVDLLNTREFGSKIYVDLEISVDGDLPLRQAHSIAEKVHDEIESAFPKVKHIMVHVNPFRNPEG